MATLTRYESFEELKADKKPLTGDLLAQKLANKDKEADEFYLALKKYTVLKKTINNLIIENE